MLTVWSSSTLTIARLCDSCRTNTSSSNGTFVNSVLVGKGKTLVLKIGDEVSVIPPKGMRLYETTRDCGKHWHACTNELLWVHAQRTSKSAFDSQPSNMQCNALVCLSLSIDTGPSDCRRAGTAARTHTRSSSNNRNDNSPRAS
jgi:hypothetical protein